MENPTRIHTDPKRNLLLADLDDEEWGRCLSSFDCVSLRQGEVLYEGALKLQAAGLIHYARGRIVVVDRAGLERRSCECYAVVRAEYARLLPPASRTVSRRTPAPDDHGTNGPGAVGPTRRDPVPAH